ncbi:MAG: hypothetical protein AAGJ40_08150 [Planctomycetota bacterium]
MAVDKYDVAVESIEEVLRGVTRLLVEQESFILNTPVFGSLSPELQQYLRSHVADAAELIYEITRLLESRHDLGSMSLWSFTHRHGLLIGAAARDLFHDLQEAVPGVPGLPSFDDAHVVQTSENEGTFQFRGIRTNGVVVTSDTEQVVRRHVYWVLQRSVEPLQLISDHTTEKLVRELQQMNANPANPQVAQQARFVRGFIERSIDPLLQAQTQAEFDQGVQQAMVVFEALAPMFRAAMANRPQ